MAAPALAEIKTANPAARGLTAGDFPRVKTLAPNVYSYEDLRPSDPGKFKTTVDLIVVTPDGVLLADAQGNVAAAQRLVKQIKTLTPLPVKYVVVCSEHDDHTGGNAALKAAWPGAVFIASPVSAKVLATSPAPPTETVADKRSIALGGTEIQILNLGRAHTGGDLSVYLPGPKILFMSEIYDHDLFPSMARAYPSEWLATITKNQALGANFIFGGHGFVDDAATMKAGLAEFKTELSAVIAEAKRLHDGKIHACHSVTDCDAAWAAHWGPYDSWSERPIQETGAVLRVYQELDGALK